MDRAVKKRWFFGVFLVIGVLGSILFYRRYRYTHLDVLEFRLSDIRLRLPCTVEDIRMCGYQVDEATGICDENEWGFGTLHIIQDEKGRICEIYTDDFGCDLEVYGNIDMGYIVRRESEQGMRGWNRAIETIEKKYGEPAEEHGKVTTYIKYKSEKEYVYVTIDRDEFFKISRIGIVAGK